MIFEFLECINKLFLLSQACDYGIILCINDFMWDNIFVNKQYLNHLLLPIFPPSNIRLIFSLPHWGNIVNITIFGIVYYIGLKTWVYIDNLLEANWLTSFGISQKMKDSHGKNIRYKQNPGGVEL